MRDSCFGSQCASFFAYKLSARTRFFHTYTNSVQRSSIRIHDKTVSPLLAIMFELASHTSTPRTSPAPAWAAHGSSRWPLPAAQHRSPIHAAPCCCIVHTAQHHTQSNKTQQAAAAGTIRTAPLLSPRRPQILKPRTSLSQWCHCARASSGPASGTCPPTPRPRHGGPSAWRSPPRP